MNKGIRGKWSSEQMAQAMEAVRNGESKKVTRCEPHLQGDQPQPCSSSTPLEPLVEQSCSFSSFMVTPKIARQGRQKKVSLK